MKHKSAKRFTAFLLSGAMLATGFAGAMPALHASAATELTTVSNGLKYRYIVKDSTSCVLKRVSDANNDWSLTTKSSVTIPDKIPGTNYVIKELGDQGQAIIHSNNSSQTRVSSITLPKQVEKINYKALWETEVPNLSTLKINLNTVKNCNADAFGSSNIQNVYAYDTTSSQYVTTGTTAGFEKYYGLVGADYIACEGDIFKVKSASMNGKLRFLNAISPSRYAKKLGYEYAKKIAATYGFDKTNISKQVKLEMIYDYMMSHLRYSRLSDSENNIMSTMCGGSLSTLALNSGVCGGFAHSFEQLCRASGFTVTDNPTTSEVVCVGSPGHAQNAVRLSASEGYYIVDCTKRADITFMRKKGYENVQFTTMYSYGVSSISSEVINVPFSASMLSNNDFASGNSFMKVINNAGNGLKVEVLDKNNTNNRFINFNAYTKPAVGATCKLSQIAIQNPLPQFISSYSYFKIRIGGTDVNLTQNPQTVTVNGRQYTVRLETKDFGNGQPQVCSCPNYYQLTITPV